MKKYLFLFTAITQACVMSGNGEIDRFNSRISDLIGNSESAKVVASELTDFKWNSLCFRRGDFLSLTFSGEESEAVELKLNYDEYFIDEAYVKGSLDGKCLSGQDVILIKRKYLGYSKTIEFVFIEK